MSDLVQLPDGRWAEPRPGQCERCGAPWPLGETGWVLVATHFGRRIYHCLTCGWITGLGREGLAAAPMNAPSHHNTG